MLNRILTLALMLSVVICCIFVFTEAPRSWNGLVRCRS